MGFISREEFLKQQEERQARAAAAQNGGPKVGYFNLKNDGDEAIVRFCYDDPDQFDIMTTHQTTIDGKYRRVNCIRESFKGDPSSCPMCAAGVPVQQRFYIKLLEYTRGDDGSIVAVPKIWERPTSYVTTIGDLFTEYGNISDNVFKIKRNGAAGSLQTTYSIMLANPSIYNASLYPKNNNAFDGYNVLGGAVLDKTYDELMAMVGEPEKPADPVGDVFTGKGAAVEQPTQAPRTVSYY